MTSCSGCPGLALKQVMGIAEMIDKIVEPVHELLYKGIIIPHNDYILKVLPRSFRPVVTIRYHRTFVNNAKFIMHQIRTALSFNLVKIYTA